MHEEKHQQDNNLWNIVRSNWGIILTILAFAGAWAVVKSDSSYALKLSQTNSESINLLKTDTKINANDIGYVKETVGKTDAKVDRILALLSTKLVLK